MVKEKRYACATERFSLRTLSPLSCISFCFWSEGASWRNIMALKLLKSHTYLFCNAICVLWKGILERHLSFFFFSIRYLILLDTDWSGLCHYYCLFIMERIRNRCQYTVQKTVSCQKQNGTETVVQRLFQSCRWPGPCANLIRYREKKWSHGINWIILYYSLSHSLTDSVYALLLCIFPATELWWDLCTEWPTGKSLLWNGDAVRDSMGKTAERVREIISHQSQVHWSITEAFECLWEKIIASC